MGDVQGTPRFKGLYRWWRAPCVLHMKAGHLFILLWCKLLKWALAHLWEFSSELWLIWLKFSLAILCSLPRPLITHPIPSNTKASSWMSTDFTDFTLSRYDWTGGLKCKKNHISSYCIKLLNLWATVELVGHRSRGYDDLIDWKSCTQVGLT